MADGAAVGGVGGGVDLDDVGHLAPGARADVVLLDAPSRVHLAYRPGVPLVAATWKDGIHLPARENPGSTR